MPKNNLENKSSVLHFRKHGHSAGQYQREKDLQSFYEQEEAEKKEKHQSGATDHMKKILSLVEKMEISGEYQNDPEQKELLEKKKDQAKKLMDEVLRKIGEYLSIIARMASVKASESEYEPHAYRKKFEEVDQLRRINHNALMSNIDIANRFIQKNFGQAKEEMIERWENDEFEAGRPILHAKRVDFPENIIVVDGINLEDRDQVKKWAEQIGRNLSELKNGLE
jgi:hypothetical protein